MKKEAYWLPHPSTMMIKYCSACGAKVGGFNTSKKYPTCPSCNSSMSTVVYGDIGDSLIITCVEHVVNGVDTIYSVEAKSEGRYLNVFSSFSYDKALEYYIQHTPSF